MFWETSALIPVWSRRRSARRWDLYRPDRAVIVWWGTRVEGISALASAARRGALRQDDLARAVGRLRSIVRAAVVIEPSTAVRDRAERLLLTHELRAADALQLAAALVAVQDRPEAFEVVTLDRRLRGAAEREGFSVRP